MVLNMHKCHLGLSVAWRHASVVGWVWEETQGRRRLSQSIVMKPDAISEVLHGGESLLLTLGFLLDSRVEALEEWWNGGMVEHLIRTA